jgi:ubiquinone biosynthesis protein UbiJ
MLTATLENLLNRGLPRSPRARVLCAELAGRSLALEARELARLRISSNGATLELRRDAAPADATLSGSPLSILGLLGGAPQTRLQRGEVQMGGDTELAQKFHELLGLIKPDAEEELAGLLGDVPAHQLARLARAGLNFVRRAADTGVMNAAEYLGHERADLVPRAEGEQFLRGVDAVREGVDRAAARLENLARRRGAP